MIKLSLNPQEFFRRSRVIERSIDTDLIADAAAASQLNRIRVRFLNQEATDGSRWPESRAAQRRAASGRGGGTLFDTGSLFHSIGVERSGVGERSVGTEIPYAEEHQEGLEGNPKREFIGVNDDDTAAMVRVTELLIRAALRRR